MKDPVFGTSRHLVQGPSAAVCAVSAAVITPTIGAAALGTSTAVAYSAALALAAGAIYVALGLLRMGWVSTFLSKAVMAGFVLGFSLGIIVDQADTLLGVDGGRGSYMAQLWTTLKDVPDTSLATLQALRRPGRTLARQEACDADPMLVRAAKHHGEPSTVDCPVCESDDLVNLTYVFGEQLGQYSGRIKRTAELEQMAHEFGEFKVVVVEVCPACGWNQMILSYLLGDGVKRKPPRRQQTVEDIYG